MSARSITQGLAAAACTLRHEDLSPTLLAKAHALIADTLVVAAAGRADASGLALSAEPGAASGACRVWFGGEADRRLPAG